MADFPALPETGDEYSSNKARISVSQAPQPEQAPVALDRLSKSLTPLSISRSICATVVPLHLQMRSSLVLSVIAGIDFIWGFLGALIGTAKSARIILRRGWLFN